jgi:tetratricopeptide (TPR) repeat protein
MLQAAGVAAAGPAVRNWDNARGHFEALDLVRLNERVLALSGGNWMAAPPAVRWTSAEESERERLLETRVDGRASLLKDPRTLLVLPFWRAARAPFLALGVIRPPLAVARSLSSWRELPLETGIALWTAHNRALLAEHEAHGTPLVDFGRAREVVVAALERACGHLELQPDRARFLAAFDERLVHHSGESESVAGLAEAEQLYARLAECARSSRAPRAPSSFPNAELANFAHALAARDSERALQHARAALERAADAGAVAVPVMAAFSRARAFSEARRFLQEASSDLEPVLLELLRGKLLLASGDAQGAVDALERACAGDESFFQAHRLLPHALRAAGRRREAARALAFVVEQALYPHGPLAQLAEWAWEDGDRAAALEHMARAIDAAPRHRRGRVRARRAAWLLQLERAPEAELELLAAQEEDPEFPRTRRALENLRAGPHSSHSRITASSSKLSSPRSSSAPR